MLGIWVAPIKKAVVADASNNFEIRFFMIINLLILRIKDLLDGTQLYAFELFLSISRHVK